MKFRMATEAESKLRGRVDDLEGMLKRAEAKLAKAEAALRKYADPSNYEDSVGHGGDGRHVHGPEILEDKGGIARAAIREVGNGS